MPVISAPFADSQLVSYGFRFEMKLVGLPFDEQISHEVQGCWSVVSRRANSGL